MDEQALIQELIARELDYARPRLSEALRSRTPRGDYYSGGVLHVDIPSGPEPRKTTRDRYGLPEIEPLPEAPPAREMYSPTEHLLTGELVQKGMPTRLAKPVDTFINLGRATGDTARSMTGAPLMDWATSRGTDLAEALHDWQPDLPEQAVAAISPRSATAQTAEQKARKDFSQEAFDRQKQMSEAGYPIKKIDGIWGRETEAIWKQFMADEPKRRAAAEAKAAADRAAQERAAAAATAQANAAAEGERARAAGQEAIANAERAKAEADRIRKELEESRLAAEANKALEERRKLGFEELKRRQKDHKKTLGYQFEQNVVPISMAAGAGLGHYVHKKVIDAYNRALQSRNATSNQLLSSGPSDDVAKRVGDLNRFWTEGQNPVTPMAKRIRGQSGPEVVAPFKVTQQAPHFEPNMSVPGPEKLYRMSPWDRIPDAAGIAGGLGEAGVTHWFYTIPAQEEYDAALAAVNKEPTTANIDRLFEAQQNLQKAKAIEFAGRSFAGGYGLSMAFKGRDQSRPRVNDAQNKQIQLLREYRQLTKKQLAQGGPGAPGGAPQGGMPPPPAAPPAAPAPAVPNMQKAAPPSPALAPANPGAKPAPAAPQPGAKASQSTPQELPDWATKAGVKTHPYNEQVQFPDGTWGPKIADFKRHHLKEWRENAAAKAGKTKVKTKGESSTPKAPAKDEQTGNAKPAEKEPTREIQINDLGPMRGAGLSGMLRSYA